MMNDSIGGQYIKSDDTSLACGRLYLDISVLGHTDLLSSSSLDRGGAKGDIARLESSTRNNMAEKDGSQGFFVCKEAIECFRRNLCKSLISRSEDSERTISRQSLDQASCLDCCQQGGEGGGGYGQLGYVLSRGWGWSSVVASWGSCHHQGGGEEEGDAGVHGDDDDGCCDAW